MKLSVYSEIGELKKVLLHRPSNEIENLTPEMLGKLLFDDIPFLKVAQKEHDYFAHVLKKEGVEVYYLVKLAAEAIAQEEVRLKFLSEFLDETHIYNEKLKDSIIEYLLDYDNEIIINKLVAGIRKNEVGYKFKGLTDQVNERYPFICDPLPNLYFTRDPFVVIGSGVSLGHMRSVTRCRETIFAKYIFSYHPEFADPKIPFWYNREETTTIEGGDILILNEDTLAIGISQRTEPKSIEKLCQRIFDTDVNPKIKVKTVLAFHIPAIRAYMHLDTVFTQVDYNKFTVHGGIEGPLNVYAITPGKNGIKVKKEVCSLQKILEKYLKRDVTLIRCGKGDSIIAGREQWNDGSNTLAIRPGEVVVYSRNYVTNKILEDNGIKLHVMPCSELSRGRGGPRCMSMPLERE